MHPPDRNPAEWILKSRRAAARTASVVFSLATALLLPACNTQRTTALPANETTAPPPVTRASSTQTNAPAVMPASATPTQATLQQVTGNPNAYDGQIVTVTAQVNTILGDKAYTIGGNHNPKITPLLILGTSPLPGVPRTPVDKAVVGNDIVSVTGRLIRLNRDNVPEPLRSQLKDSLYTDYAGRPAILAQRVFYTIIVGGLPAIARRAQASGPQTATAGTLLTGGYQSSLVGKWVALNDVKVQSVISDRGFWVESPSGQRLFVVLNKALDRGRMERLVDIDKGQILNVLGVLHRMPNAKQAQQMWTVDAKEAQRLAGDNVYLRADSIQILVP